MTPENARPGAPQARESAPENGRGRQPAPLSPGSAEVLADYQRHLACSPLIGHSGRTYASAVRGYLAWLDGAEVDGDPLTDHAARDWAVRDYRSHLVIVAKRAPATVNKVMAALDDFYVWRGLGKASAKRAEIPQRAPRALSVRAAVRYLRAVEACGSARDRAIALVPFYAGARIAETAGLDVDDVALSARKGELRLIGKGEKSRTVPVHAKLREALAAWLAERPGWPGADGPALFLSRRGGRLTTDAIGDVIAGITAAAGLDDHVTAHVLRHTFGTSMVRDGVDLVTVAQLMGHARLETTRGYVLPTEEDLERAVGSLPVDG
jgi:site-specific recombinase XerD